MNDAIQTEYNYKCHLQIYLIWDGIWEQVDRIDESSTEKLQTKQTANESASNQVVSNLWADLILDDNSDPDGKEAGI